MKLNKGFEFTLKTTKETNLLKKLGNNIYSKETSHIYYNGYLDICRNKNIMLIFLSKEKNGYITYLCNGLYGVGEFIFYTTKEIDKIVKTWNLIENKKTIDFCSWRMLSYKDSVITEFVDPLSKLEFGYQESLIELEYKKSMVEMLKEELDEISKRYN